MARAVTGKMSVSRGDLKKANKVYTERRIQRAALNTQDYQRYMMSEEWRQKRALLWKQQGKSCARCGGTDKLHVHHMTYERFKQEELEDLIGLCERCHNYVHYVHRQHGGNLMTVTLRVVKSPPAERPPERPPFVPVKNTNARNNKAFRKVRANGKKTYNGID